MTAPLDHLAYNRQAVASAYRRLADAALTAAEVFSDPDAVTAELDAVRVTTLRLESARHAMDVLSATRIGIARAAQARVA